MPKTITAAAPPDATATTAITGPAHPDGDRPRRTVNDRTGRPPDARCRVSRSTCRDSTALDLHRDPAELTAALVDIPSVSGAEGADRRPDRGGAARRSAVRGGAARERRAGPHRTSAGRPGCCWPGTSTPCRSPTTCRPGRDGDLLHGCGTTDMKSGDAMLLHLAATVADPSRDLTFVFYDCEEVEPRPQRPDPDRAGAAATGSTADLAILGEPTNGLVEAGCQGTLSAGGHAHRPARALGAVVDGRPTRSTRAAPVLERLADYRPRTSTSTAARTGRA